LSATDGRGQLKKKKGRGKTFRMSKPEDAQLASTCIHINFVSFSTGIVKWAPYSPLVRLDFMLKRTLITCEKDHWNNISVDFGEENIDGEDDSSILSRLGEITS
jgi:hypothetical protein